MSYVQIPDSELLPFRDGRVMIRPGPDALGPYESVTREGVEAGTNEVVVSRSQVAVVLNYAYHLVQKGQIGSEPDSGLLAALDHFNERMSQ